MSSILSSLTDGLTITRRSDWLVFTERLQELVHSGRVRRIAPLKNLGFASVDEWYLDPASGEIYVHVVPDSPILPQWININPLAPLPPAEVNPGGLNVIPTGPIDATRTRSLKAVLNLLIRNGTIEVLRQAHIVPSDSTETWFKDVQMKTAYRLIEKGGDDNRWEKVPLSELQTKIQ